MFQPKRTLLLVLVLLATAATGRHLSADDRDLLRSSTGRPYVFILLDTSGSMHWTPQCTEEQFNADPRECDFLCPSGDCFAPLNGDDPASKLYQAKEALYEVIRDTDNVDFGFATFNQDQLRMRAKHWLYEATEDGPTLNVNYGAYPVPGAQEVFGLHWDCDTGDGDNNIGCYVDFPADLDDPWELERVRRLPKGGMAFNTSRQFIVRDGTSIYRVTYAPAAGNLGDASIEVTVTREFRSCSGSTCSWINPRSETVTFSRVSDFTSWDIGTGRNNPQQGFFTQGAASDSPAGNTCTGWDPNDDTAEDEFSGYSIRWPTAEHGEFHPELTSGDVLPLSWETSNRDAILRRLAPNLALGEAVPDFRTARYFENTRTGGRNHLRLNATEARPILAFGATPLGDSISDFRDWYEDWRDVAPQNDPDWGCRRKFLLVITDGDETCGGTDAACDGTEALNLEESLRTYVVAFGVEGGEENTLTCMAEEGGTTEPVYPQNKQQLVDALNLIFGEIAEEASTFASAAVPSVQAQVVDKIYLTNFTPLNSASMWDGHVDAYLRPLPLTEDNRPDRGRVCAPGEESGCLAWDAGQSMLAQAPTAAEILEGNFRIGNGAAQRRVIYPFGSGAATVPRSHRLFVPPEEDETSEWQDLLIGLGLTFDPMNLGPAQQDATEVIEFTLRQRVETIDAGGTPTEITYVLGDIFHSTPSVVTTPERFRYFSGDLYANAESCTDPTDPNPGYRCFFQRSFHRRKMVVVGANDGQLHIFDGGRFNGSLNDDTVVGTFDNGTGREIVSIVPRTQMPGLTQRSEVAEHLWGVDGSPRIDDVFIDPAHNGTPTPGDRRWRTVGIVGMREGGSAYLAVDLTQPDRFQTGPLAEGVFLPEYLGDYVPSCLTNYSAADCGPVPFASILWEFTDSEIPDQDENGFPDLGETWSRPNTGRLRVIEDGEPVDKFVAVFGGGMDPAKSDTAGDWLYIVDIETGRPIYKRQLVGSAPSDPAAVDTNQNGYLDTIYIGTTAGFMYKVDVSVPVPIEEVEILGVTVNRVTSPLWEPFQIFTTAPPVAEGEEEQAGRPIHFPPAVIYVARLGRYALGFGTGDREDLWSISEHAGRFYMILDDGFAEGDAGLPLDESDFPLVPAVGSEEAGASYLLSPESGLNGWIMTLEDTERVITRTFSLSGITVFTSYIPEFLISETGEEGEEEVATCAKTGVSRIYVVFTDTANAVIELEDEKTRFWQVSEFVTDPFVERSATGNEPGEGNEGGGPLSEALHEVMETLKGLFPDNCRFGNFTQNLQTIQQDTGLFFIAPVPICAIERNWKEF